ncbi:MAG: GrpB family protein [Oscillospiraceae bacterium]|jgi:GrpB-like predicted nucleotidyltransferase (UPF0157 family)|nr:GrpB family protein [Oscillospiraceae bacterium]
MVISEYNGIWLKQFLEIDKILRQNLSKIKTIEHVGSTAIIGMYAKPIIDIIIVINNENDFDIIKNELEFTGYFHNGDQGIPGREAFKRKENLDNNILDNFAHHLYVCTYENSEFKRHILFRDYLNKYKEARDQYNNIKHEILKKVGYDNRKDYVDIKEKEYRWFFEGIIEKAEEENKQKKHNST